MVVRGVLKIQNRLFIIHHSAKEQRREILLRSKWEYKEKVYKEYADYITKQSEFIKYKSCKVDIIYIGEKKNGDLTNFIQSK